MCTVEFLFHFRFKIGASKTMTSHWLNRLLLFILVQQLRNRPGKEESYTNVVGGINKQSKS